MPAISGTAPITAGQEDVGGDRPGEGEEELRVRRSEEELKVGTREREAGAVKVRKRAHRPRANRLPKKRMEVTVERVPVVEGETAHSEIGKRR